MVWLLGDARPIFVHTCPHFQSVDKCGHVWLRTTSRTQCWRIGDCTILKSNISAFRKVLRHQNRFSSRRERSKNVKFDGFWTKSTLALQIRLISIAGYPYKEQVIEQIWAAKNKNKKIRGAQNFVASLKNIYS